eukprot:scaffold280022_cov12-Tisochrysis_lutea.AAC.1
MVPILQFPHSNSCRPQTAPLNSLLAPACRACYQLSNKLFRSCDEAGMSKLHGCKLIDTQLPRQGGSSRWDGQLPMVFMSLIVWSGGFEGSRLFKNPPPGLLCDRFSLLS